MLIALTGLPGVGKSLVAEAIGIALPATVLSVDPIEAAMWRAGIRRDAPTGLAAYSVAGAVAESQLRLGGKVVIDAVNAAPQARTMWRSLARGYGEEVRVVEVVCSDLRLHRARVTRRADADPAAGHPGWEEVESRRAEYRPWIADRLTIDTVRDLEENVKVLLRALAP